ncbi:MAG: PilN domain-containing protein [Deltaproteobacteria bacterium]|nr:PilN domain-containing protein [Deltaproteobacteria bacterium]
MIRINLLPVRAAKKKESLMLHGMAAGAALILVIILSMGVYVFFRSKVSVLNGDIEKGNAELVALEAKTGELQNIIAEKNKVQGKLDVVDRLSKARSGPIDMYKLFSKTVPDYAWVINVTDKGSSVRIEGMAISEIVVSEFMRNLENTGVFAKVELFEAASKGGVIHKGSQQAFFNYVIDLYRK